MATKVYCIYLRYHIDIPKNDGMCMRYPVYMTPVNNKHSQDPMGEVSLWLINCDKMSKLGNVSWQLEVPNKFLEIPNEFLEVPRKLQRFLRI